MKIQTLLFDLGNVLLDFSHDRMCQQMADLFQVTPPKMHEMLFQSEHAQKYERGQISEVEFQSFLEETFQQGCSREELQRACGDIFTPKPAMAEIVRALRSAGVRLVILSNTCQTHIEWIAKTYDLLCEFDHLVLSYEVGACKPEPLIFQTALEQIQCPPQNCLYTDDIEEYVVAAKQYGLNAEVFESEHQFSEVLERHGIELKRP